MAYNPASYCTMRVDVSTSQWTKVGATMESNPDLIWIVTAAEEYHRSRKWLDDQVEAGKLSYATIEGDRKVYLLRSELDRLLRPTIRRTGDDAPSQVG